MSSPAQPLSVPQCDVCGTEVAVATKRCPNCGLSLPAARGADVIAFRGLVMLGAILLGIYAVVLLIVAAAR